MDDAVAFGDSWLSEILVEEFDGLVFKSGHRD